MRPWAELTLAGKHILPALPNISLLSSAFVRNRHNWWIETKLGNIQISYTAAEAAVPDSSFAQAFTLTPQTTAPHVFQPPADPLAALLRKPKDD